MNTQLIRILFNLKRYARCLAFAARGFRENQCNLRASSLTLYTLLSIVPLLAMAFGISKGFGVEQMLEQRLLNAFPGQEEVINRVIVFSLNLLQRTKGGIIASLGVVFLLWSVIKMLSHIEESFNKIWWVKENRPMIRKFADYIALLFIAPFVLIFSGSATIFVGTQLTDFLENSVIPFHSFITFSLKYLPFTSIWMLFIFFYIFIPNTRVNIKTAVAGGIIAGSFYQVGQIFYLKLQVGVSHYNAIYGSFAALPLFIIWLQISWIILLIGAEISFAFENANNIDEQDITYDAISIRSRKLIFLRIVHLCVKRFQKRGPAMTSGELSDELKVPFKITKLFLFDLVKAGVLSRVSLKEESEGYQPAWPIATLSVMEVLLALEEHGNMEIVIAGDQEVEVLEQSLDDISRAGFESKGERLLADI
ncbi:MAG: YihY/virulence factor BrkB family protein [Desulfobacteraceae bacterium]